MLGSIGGGNSAGFGPLSGLESRASSGSIKASPKAASFSDDLAAASQAEEAFPAPTEAEEALPAPTSPIVVKTASRKPEAAAPSQPMQYASTEVSEEISEEAPVEVGENEDLTDDVNAYAVIPETEKRPAGPTTREIKSIVRSEGFAARSALAPNLGPEQRSMSKFLKSMEIEIGVKPTRVVEAFAKLDQTALNASPEASADLVIDQLSLSPAQEARAQELYGSFLAELSSIRDIQTQDKSGMPVVAILSPDQVRQQNLLEGIDRLNRNFFSREAHPSLKTLDGAENRLDRAYLVGGAGERKATIDDQLSNPDFRNAVRAGMDPSATVQDPRQPRNSDDVTPVIIPGMDTEATQDLEPYSLSDADWQDSVLDDEDYEAAALSDGGVVMPIDNVLRSEVAPAAQVFDLNGRGEREPASTKQEKGKSIKGKTEGLSRADGFVPAAPKDGPSKMMTPAPVKVSAEDRLANVDKLVHSSRLLVGKGGGEMKVKMNPEGLGKVDLKVSVNDGKVDVQMVTESREAKKILEGSIDDLRFNLSHHKLNLDTVKVDVGNRADTGLNNQSQQQFHHRESARDFLNQFHNFNDARRNAFAETMTGATAGVKGRPVKTAEDVRQAHERGKQGRRLNLVA